MPLVAGVDTIGGARWQYELEAEALSSSHVEMKL